MFYKFLMPGVNFVGMVDIFWVCIIGLYGRSNLGYLPVFTTKPPTIAQAELETCMSFTFSPEHVAEQPELQMHENNNIS